MKTILLVDDDDMIRPMIREMLEGDGYQVLDAAGGPEALKVEAAHADGIDLLLSDVVMPGITGPQLAQQLRARRPHMKTMYMSGFTRMDMESQQIDVDPTRLDAELQPAHCLMK